MGEDNLIFKENQMTNYRHGENFLLRTKRVKGTKESHTEYIVGHSETGHHHVLESTSPFDVHINGAETYLTISKPAKLVHKKTVNAHKTLTIAPGFYKVIKKTEYDPWQKIKREVWD